MVNHILFTNPSARAGYDTRSIFFKWSLTGLNSEFSFFQTSCLTKAGEPSLSCYLPIAGGRIIGFIPFPRVLVLCEMLSVLSRIWTRVAVSISYDDNHYTTGTSGFWLMQLQSRYIWNIPRILKKINVSFIVHFCLGKYSFSLNAFWAYYNWCISDFIREEYPPIDKMNF